MVQGTSGVSWLLVPELELSSCKRQFPSLKKTTCMDAGGRAPKVGALGDARAVTEGEDS
jgi:hypothetical protein